ncbi:MAG: hypothetical protein AB7J35_01225 [Dehalococcoidia bacterium]
MAAATEPSAAIRFEGYSPGTEIWGATQANFLVSAPGHHAKEAAVLLNLPAAAMLAADLGKDDSPEFREAAARAVGYAALTDILARGAHFDSALIGSRAYLEEHPSVLSAARAALAE